MPSDILAALLGWLVALAIFFGFIILVRYIEHKERMALIARGINPNTYRRQRRRGNGILRAGLITTMVGMALTIGLYPVGFWLPKSLITTPFHFGPWLLPGLIPLGVGLALIISYYLGQDSGNQHDTPENERSKVKNLPNSGPLENIGPPLEDEPPYLS